MSLPTAILETILTHLTALFLTGAGGDTESARHGASEMLAAYHPETIDELRLAANIISFSFQSLEALGQAASPGLPFTRAMRLRGSAVSLNRAAVKAERRLAQLQKARQHGTPAPEPVADQPEPRIEKATALIQETATITCSAKASGQTWTQAYQQRRRDQRLAARIAAQSIPPLPVHAPVAQPG